MEMENIKYKRKRERARPCKPLERTSPGIGPAAPHQHKPAQFNISFQRYKRRGTPEKDDVFVFLHELDKATMTATSRWPFGLCRAYAIVLE
jgi:hypothetical protein